LEFRVRFYAERPLRAGAQVVADLLAVGWIAACWWAAMRLRDWTLGLRAPGQRLVDAGGTLQHTFGGAAQTAGRVPFVGHDLAGALGNGTDAGQVMIDAGRSQMDAVQAAATGLAIAVVVLGLVPVLWYAFRRRLRYARAASAAASMRADAPDLLALRALGTQPVRRLLAVDGDPAAAWRRGDPEAIDQLAGLHLAALGLRPRRNAGRRRDAERASG
jgi:hypothetical protein